MRARIIFNLTNKGATLSFHHQKLIASLLKEIVSNKYHSNDILPINFSGLKGQTKVRAEGLAYISSKVTLVVSSTDEDFISYLISCIFQRKNLLLGNLILKPEYVEQEIIDIVATETRYLCMSPIVIQNVEDSYKNKTFICPSTNEFSDLLYESTIVRMESSKKYVPQQLANFYKFQVLPDNTYLQQLGRKDKKFARIYTAIQGTDVKEVRGYTFPFTLYAAPEVQNFVFNYGFGELTNCGFGMLDTIRAEVRKELKLLPKYKNI